MLDGRLVPCTLQGMLEYGAVRPSTVAKSVMNGLSAGDVPALESTQHLSTQERTQYLVLPSPSPSPRETHGQCAAASCGRIET